MILSLVVLLIVGFVAGLIARALLPGNDSMSLLHTTVLGVIGSVIGGLLGYVLFGADIDDGLVQTSGFIGSILGSLVALIAYRVFAQDRRVLG